MMKAASRMNVMIHLIAIAVSLFAVGTVAAQAQKSVELNEIAFRFAMDLIKQGDVVPDAKGAWTKHRPSTDAENEFIRLHGFAQYAKWHLGIDGRFPESSKQRYKFPYGDFKIVHRCGLLAVKSRAREYGYNEIEDAARKLLQMIRISWPRPHNSNVASWRGCQKGNGIPPQPFAAQMIEAATKFGNAATFSQKLISFQSPCRSLQTLQSGAWTATGGAAGGGLRMR